MANDERLGTLRTQGYQARVDAAWQALPVRQAEWQTWLQTQAALKTNAQATSDKGENLRQLDDMVSDLVRMQVLQPHAIDLVNEAAAMHARVLKGDFGKQFAATPDWMQANYGTEQFTIWNAGKVSDTKPLNITYARALQTAEEYQRYWETQQLPANGFNDNDLTVLRWLLQTTVDHALENAGDGMTPEYSAQIQAILKRNALGAPAAGRGGVESEKSKVASVPDSAPAAAPTPSLSTLHFPLSTTSTSPAAPIETPPVVAAPVTPPIAAVNAAQPSGTPGASAGDTLEEVRGQKSEGISQTEKKKDAMPPPVKRPAASRKVARAQPKAAAKEPWQMRSVALVLKTAEKIFPLSSKVEIKNGSPVYTYETTVKFGGVDQRFAIEARSQPNAYTQIERLHKKMIERALAEGKPVPSEVLADYPDLQKQAEAPPVKPPKPPAVATAAPAARDRAEALGLPFTLDTSIDKLKRAIAKADAKGKPDGLSLAASPEVTLGTGPASGAQEATGPGGEVKTVMPPPVNKERAPVVDKNERSYVFVPAPDGQQDWGHITQQIADEATRPLVVAPLRVQEGWHGSSGDGLGRVHVQDHWRDMRKVGYTSPEEFLHYVLRGFTRMYFQPKNGRYWLTRPNGGQAVAVVELQLTPEQFYGVTTAYPERANKKIGAELIWERREPAQQASGQPVAPSSPTVSTPVSAAMAHGPDQSRAQGNIGAPAGEVKARAVQTVPGFAAPQRSKAAAATFPEPTTAQIKSAFKRNDVATVLANSKADAGPFDGGCLIVAHAFLQLLPQGKLVRMESLVDGQPQAEHYGVRFPDGRILDADGFAADGDAWIKLFSEQELLRRAAVVKEGWIPSEAPSDPSAEKKLANVLRQAFIAYAAKKPAQAVPSLGTPAGDLFQALEKTAAASKTSKSATPAVVPTSGKKARVMPPPMPSLAARAAAKYAVALRAGPLNKLAAVKLMNEVAGGTLAEGKYTDKDLHDAIELAVNQVVLSQGHYGQEATPEKAAENILALKALIENAPTQSTRTPEMDKLQQFSTPPPLAYAVAWLAHVQPGEVVLEPSAGVGGIAVFARMMGGRVLANELSTRRAALLRSLGIAKQVTIENAEHLHAILAPKIAAGELPAIDRVVMNPPFSHGAVSGKSNTLIGAQHVEEALKLLSDGGRLVAIVGEGMALDKPRFRSWWNKIAQTYHVRANIHVDGNEFRKYGTTFGLQVLVIDKTGPTPDNSTLSGSVQKIEELPELLKGVRHDIGTTERGAAEPSGVEGVGQEPTAAGPAADALAGAGQRGPGRSPAGRGPAADSGDLFAQRPNPSPRPAPGGAGTGTGGTGTNVTGAGGGVRSLGTGAGAGSRPSPESTAARSSPGLTEKLTVETVNHAPPKIGEHQVFYDYRPAKVNIPGAQPHPTPLVESSAMASIVPPDPTYSPKIPQRLVTTGALTDVQLEQLVYAGQSHAQHLPNGQRQGYFIGDGTGVGKGRMLAGIILDNWNQGERKAVWISAKPGLIRDAGRDITALGMKSDQLIDLTDRKIMRLLPSRAEGIAFLTYRGLSMDNPGLTPEGQLQPTEKDPRIAALVKWLPKNFKGVIGLDEVHNAGNAIDIKGKMGVEKASQAGKAVVDLQNLFPDARIVLMSATGATEITNLGYGDRLGLWGPGTAFGDKRKFFDKIGAAGPTGMEIVARDNKGRGIFLARTLSFKGVEQEQLVHKLTPDQTKVYDEMSRMWQMVMGQVDDTMASTGANKNADARKNALSALYGSQQRFYGQLLTALQMPTVLDDMRRELAAGKSAVLQVVNTNEATQERELAKAAAAGAEDDYLETLDLSPKDGLLQYVNASFPVAKYEMHLDAEGNEVWEPVKDSQGNPVPDPAAVAAKQRLLDKLALLKVPANPMEMLLDTFGAENVAEVTGRSRRVVQKVNPETGKLERQIENRNEARRDIETKEFLDGKRRILIFSDAGGTGFSYHAGATFKNQQPRVHYLIQAGWRSDNAVQGLGRTHRSDQVLPPFYKLVSTDIKGHQRFISTISRRIGQLGALTAGERKAGGAGLFSEENNLENEYARDAVRQLFTDLFTGDVRGFDLDTIARQLGYAKTTVNSRTGERETVNTLIDPKTGGLNQTKLPTVQRFLNRVLVMEFAKQNQLFEEFIKRMERRIEVAKLDGSFDPGLQTLKAKAVRKVADTVVYQHPGTSATTRMVDVDTDYPQMPTPWSKVERNPRWGTPELFVRNKKSGKLYALFTGPGRTDDRGRVLATWRRMGVSHDDLVAQDMITTGWEGAKYDEVEKERAKKLWTAEYAKAPDFKTERETYITGLFTPIWDRIGIARPKIYRVGTTDGDVFLGIRVPPAVVDAVRQRLSAGTAEQLTPEQVFNAVLDDGRTFDLANGWQLKRSKVAGESRLEILGFDAENLRELEDYYGATLERINFTPRAFVPTEPTAGVAVLQKLLERAPIAAADASTQTTLPGSGSAAGGTLRETPAAYSASSQDQTATPEFKRWFGDWETVTKVQAVRQLAPLLIKATAVSQQAFESAYQALVSGVTRDGRTVQFVHKIMGKLEGHRGHELLFRAAPQFKALLQQAIPAWSEPERNPPAGSAVVGFHHYVAKAGLDGRAYYLRFTVQEIVDRRVQLHSAFVSDVEIVEADPASPLSGLSTPTGMKQIGFDRKLADWLRSVNPAEVSKVVDAEGKPLVMYHGTGADFDVFDLGKAGVNFDVPQERGAFFTNNAVHREFHTSDGKGGAIPHVQHDIGSAGAYADNAAALSKGAPNVMPVFLSIKNPLVIEEDSDGAGIHSLFESSRGIRKEILRAAEAGQHDGLLIRDLGYKLPSGEPETIAIVFSPSQIKSATGNRGTFDAEDPNILHEPPSAYSAPSRAAVHGLLDFEGVTSPTAAQDLSADLQLIAAASPEPYHFTPAGQSVLRERRALPPTTSDAKLRAEYEKARKAQAQQKVLQGTATVEDVQLAFGSGRTVSSVLKEYVESASAKIATLRGLKLESPQDTAAALRVLRSPFVESLKVLALNSQGRVLSAQVVTVGTLDSAQVHPREVFANLPPGTKSIVVAHNHPSGDPTPSAEDVRITRELVAAGKVAGVYVADHIITNGEKFKSLRETGLVEFFSAGGKGIPGQAARLPPKATTKLLPPPIQAPWEVLRRDTLVSIRAPEKAAQFARALRQAAPGCGH
ncbi:MAG: strawberry notch family protein, partial [Kiritimatiellaeota bacterium]|nr:strawberry notch family protein [Kiritimatiellota bacterium]